MSSTRNASETRPSKRVKRSPLIECPLCHEQIEKSLLSHHYQMELMQLDTPAASLSAKTRGKRSAAVAAWNNISGGRKELSTSEQVLNHVRKNRTNRRTRLTTNHDFTDDRPPSEEAYSIYDPNAIQTCFMCGELLHGSSDDINSHIDACLARTGGSESTNIDRHQTPSENPVNERGDHEEAFEEYTWAGQTRVRITTMLEGGLRAAGIQQSSSTSKKNTQESDVDDDLDIEDEGEEYGQAQYTEKDLFVRGAAGRSGDEESAALWEMVSGGAASETSLNPPSNESRPLESKPSPSTYHNHSAPPNDGAQLPDDSAPGSALLVASLRQRLRDLEQQPRLKCLICLDPYKHPLVSIVCWHVHCEECWLQSLVAKKVCPQCQKITVATDLRKIYL
ncbi:uncharacterized protein VTP21DRAFT_3682 [Calcarisporiella thermophila]|uniref:uncharacterized protein n=1 Tax=Calcarisporiella thermophila TaxID=911321 RepID=UPI003743660E